METIDNKELIFRNEELKKTVSLLLENGFKVFTSYGTNGLNRISYIYYEENNNLAYLQTEYSGLKYSTVHNSVNGSGFGTGFGLCEEHYINLTIEDLRKAFILAPRWVKGDLTKISKYKGMQDYIDRGLKILTTVEIV